MQEDDGGGEMLIAIVIVLIAIIAIFAILEQLHG